jgi:hypothetical protein
MTLPLRRKHQTTRPNFRPWKNINLVGALALGLLGTNVPPLTAAELQWGRPARAQATRTSDSLISAEAVEQEFDAIVQEAPSDISHDSAVMAAAWEEDDALAAELDSAPEGIVSEDSLTEETAPQAGESRSVITKRTAANPLNTVDPFEADDRFAQLPNDPFDEPTGDAIPELNSNLDDVENALDREVERREADNDAPADETDPLKNRNRPALLKNSSRNMAKPKMLKTLKSAKKMPLKVILISS